MATLPSRIKVAPAATRHVYDVVVFGSQLGGALCAALLAKRGARVLWVEHDGLGPGYVHDGFLLPFAPFVLPSIRAMPVAEQALTELGMTEQIRRAARTHTLQLILADHRPELGDEKRTRAELTREYGQNVEPLISSVLAAQESHRSTDPFFLESESLPPRGWLERWRVARRARRTPALNANPPLQGDSEVERLLLAMIPFATYQAAAAPLAVSRALSQVLHAPARFPGGREALRELLAKRLTELGGAYIARDEGHPGILEAFTFEGRRLSGVKVLGSDTVYRAHCIVAATDSGVLRRLLPEKRRHRQLTEELDRVTIERFMFALNWVVEASALPRGMSDLLLVETSEADFGTILIQASPARLESGKEDPAHVTLSAGVFLPLAARELGEKYMTQVSDRLNRELDRILPFVDRRRVLASAPYLHAKGNRGSRLFPHPLYAAEENLFQGVSGLAPRSAVPNLFYASREVLPGLGLEGELITGSRVARLVMEALHKRPVHRRAA
ncbi:MAG: desaturase [Myxococcaceae bacterium]